MWITMIMTKQISETDLQEYTIERCLTSDLETKKSNHFSQRKPIKFGNRFITTIVRIFTNFPNSVWNVGNVRQ